MWEKVQKNEKVDESKLKPVKLAYTLCHPAGCTAEMETRRSPRRLKTGGGLMVFAVNAAAQPVAFPVPLDGFEQAYAGEPVDNKQYGEARRALMQQIAQRQQQMVEEQKKQQAKEEPKGSSARRRSCASRRRRRPRRRSSRRISSPLLREAAGPFAVAVALRLAQRVELSAAAGENSGGSCRRRPS